MGVCVNTCIYMRMMTFYTLSNYFTVFAYGNLIVYVRVKINCGVLILNVLKYTECLAD